MNSEPKSEPHDDARYFVLGAWSPDNDAHQLRPAVRDTGQLARFLGDWLARCLPLPLCSATSERIFEAYRVWCRLQGIAQPASLQALVSHAVSIGFNRARHIVRPHGNDQAGQHTVLHPPKTAPLKSGGQLDAAASVFALALTRWREATGEAPARPTKAKT